MESHEPAWPRRDHVALIASLVVLADDCRATAIERDARLLATPSAVRIRQLAMRLRHHLYEHQRALTRSASQGLARLNALAIARVVLERGLDHALRQPDLVRAQLRDRLGIARTKFVMAAKADALVALESRMTAHPNRALRTEASGMAHRVALTALEPLWHRAAADVHLPAIAFAKRLCADLDVCTTELGETLPSDALIDLAQAAPGSFHAEIAVRLRGTRGPLFTVLAFSPRTRVAAAARDELATLLQSGADAVVERLLAYYDHAVAATDARFRERLDGVEATLLTAYDFAESARRAGDDGLLRARHALVRWSAALADIVDGLPD